MEDGEGGRTTVARGCEEAGFWRHLALHLAGGSVPPEGGCEQGVSLIRQHLLKDPEARAGQSGSCPRGPPLHTKCCVPVVTVEAVTAGQAEELGPQERLLHSTERARRTNQGSGTGPHGVPCTGLHLWDSVGGLLLVVTETTFDEGGLGGARVLHVLCWSQTRGSVSPWGRGLCLPLSMCQFMAGEPLAQAAPSVGEVP